MSEPVTDTGGAFTPEGDMQAQAGTAPAEPTPAQSEQQATQEGGDEPRRAEEEDSAERARKQYEEDARVRRENPSKPVVREAQQGVGGESFDYLKTVSAR